ncbi:hypothetical protein [Paracoccus sp. (in: a-proteobacteria)]|uniref:hypothetical protein n=1 Tax=Paracoccus sp. TaxID=267 RepID=UPI0026E01D69|nr:hypothetical protein [Paracoccus sp. (in: a-proteobacteria)]MDO5648142.1 hypothetical protein [Paracoccus sp. (in: a-proteobacteria)]
MTKPNFPRQPDGEPYAWGLSGDAPETIWERFSPLYESQADRLWCAIDGMGLTPVMGGAGDQDGEYIAIADASGEWLHLFHLEDPSEAQELAALTDAGLRDLLIRVAAAP